MGWNKDGSLVRAEYCGTMFDGVVLSSRVKYGGKVQYKVLASEPIVLPFCDEPRNVVLIDDDEVITDWGIVPDYNEEVV
jgi:hypothetical protein